MTFILTKKIKKLIFSIIFLMTLLLIVLNFQLDILGYFFSSKVWAHRVNSIEKFEETKKLYSGVELDIVYDSINNYFDVNHPPAQSIDLSLTRFLKTKKDYNNFGLWLDFKNLNKANNRITAEKLDSITNALNIDPHNVIVESTHPIYLEEFSKKGFKTSFYLPDNITELSENELQAHYNFMQSNSIDFISSNVNDYYFMKDKFTNTKILTWIINAPPKTKNLYTLKRSLINFKRNLSLFLDEDVEVILLKHVAKRGNR